MEIYAYLSNQWGFSDARKELDKVSQKLEDMGIISLNPFVECGKNLDLDRINGEDSYKARVKLWAQFNRTVTPTNNALMKKAQIFLALMDGGHTVDDGVASEIGYYAGLVEFGKNPLGRIIGLRTDFRSGENLGARVNPQIEGFIRMTGGDISASVEDFYGAIAKYINLLNNS